MRKEIVLHHLLHQVHDPLKCALFICCTLSLSLKELTDVSHDFGLLLIALVILWTKARFVGFQPLWVLQE